MGYCRSVAVTLCLVNFCSYDVLKVRRAWSENENAFSVVQGFLLSPTPHAFVAKSKWTGTRDNIISASREGLACTASSRIALLASKDTAPSSADDEFVEAEDLEALQALFSKYCDSEGLMTKVSVMQVPSISELMADGDLLAEEFDDIWDKAAKFPDVKEESEDRVDVDSFVQIYRDIDDLFEDEDDDDQSSNDSVTQMKDTAGEKPAKSSSPSSAAIETTNDETDEDEDDQTMEAELETIFESICDDNKLLSKSELRSWNEVARLREDGLLGEDEFDDLWTKTKKNPGSQDQIDVDGFLSFNVALDSLFEFDDDEEDDDLEDETATDSASESDLKGELDKENNSLDKEEPSTVSMVEGEGLSARALYAELANARGMVGREDLMRWSELREMLEEGDLLESELEEIFLTAAEGENELRESRFEYFMKAIDDLFEDEDDDDDSAKVPPPSSASIATALKQELMETLDDINDPELLPCGLECSERDQRAILGIVNELEAQKTNMIREQSGMIGMEDLAGTWELIYSSSSAMRFNKGLSGLGGSFPNGKFGGLKQVLKASKFMADAEYIERIDVNPSSASFDVQVTGDWELGKSVSLFTGEPSLVMTIVPDRVVYGPTSTRADHWKSLGPLNMLDVTYLDEELRIMRGNTAVDTVFIFRRI